MFSGARSLVAVLDVLSIVIGAPLCVYLLVRAARRARELSRAIRAFKAEQAARERQGAQADPYAALADLYGGQARAQGQREKR